MYNQGINVPINLNLITVERLHNSHLRDRRKWPFMGRWGGGGEGGNTTPAVLFFWRGVGGVQHVYFSRFMLTVAYTGNPILNDIFNNYSTSARWI